MDEHSNLVLLLSCAVLLVAVLAVRLASPTGLPSLLIYVALAVILAEGGLTTRWSVVRPALPFAIVMATVGVAVSVAVVTAIAHLLLGIDLRTSVILASVLAS